MKTPLKLAKVPGVHISSKFTLDVVTLNMPYVIGNGRVLVSVGEQTYNVEDAVARLFTASGFEVIRGDDVHLARHVLAYNFITKRQFQWNAIEGSYGVPHAEVKMILEDAERLISAYRSDRKQGLHPLLTNLEQRWFCYWGRTAPHKLRVTTFLIEFMLKYPDVSRRWLNFYLSLSYDPGGAPDLFAWNRNTDQWLWVEVKSASDSLRIGQWAWIERFQKRVADNVLVVRVMPNK